MKPKYFATNQLINNGKTAVVGEIKKKKLNKEESIMNSKTKCGNEDCTNSAVQQNTNQLHDFKVLRHLLWQQAMQQCENAQPFSGLCCLADENAKKVQ